MKYRHAVGATLTVILIVGSPSAVRAAESPVNSGLYYELGSALVSSGALNPVATNKPQFLKTRLPNVCSIWENRHNLEDVFGELVVHYLKEQLDPEGLSEQIITGIKTAPQVLLIAALQRALPGFYDYSQNLKSQIDFKVNNAELSCQSQIDKIDKGSHPLDGWIQVAGEQAWRLTLAEDYLSTSGLPEKDQHLLGAEDDVLENTRSTPIPWFGGNKGTTNDTSIKFVNDVVSAGYAALAGASAGTTYDGATAITAPTTISATALNTDASATAVESVEPRLTEYWGKSTDAAAFAIDVLGEEEIAYCEDGCSSSVKPGRGLLPGYESEFEDIITAWAKLIKSHSGSSTRPTITDFDAVSSRKVRISKHVFEALIALEGADRVAAVERLASDVAVERTVDKALALRQILRAGSNTPEVRGLDIAMQKAEKLRNDIRAEVDDFRWEIQQQNYGAGSTAASIIAAHALGGLTRSNGSLGIAQPTGGSRREGDRVVAR